MKTKLVCKSCVAGLAASFLLSSHFSTTVAGDPIPPAVHQDGIRLQETDEQVVERVRKAIENRDWDRAKIGITHALSINPDSPAALFLAAQVYWHEGARSMAMESLIHTLKAQPTFPAAHIFFARCLKESGKLEKAREEVSIAIDQGTSPFPAYRMLAEIDLEDNNFDTAISSLEAAIRFSQGSDAEDVAALLGQTRDFVERLKLFQVLHTGQSAPDIMRPLQLNSVQPRYTEEARALKIQGTTSMRVLVSENGDVDSVLFLRGPGHGLNEQAMEVARNLKFSPATRNGMPIPYLLKLNVAFQLR